MTNVSYRESVRYLSFVPLVSFVRYDTMGVKECGILEKKKDLRVQKTYSALMAAFEALMAEETFDDITVNELCARALIRMGLRSKSLPISSRLVAAEAM